MINSCSGFKSANLIGTRSSDGVENVAVFSSVTHFGSNPPILGFVLRPKTTPRNTYDNLRSNPFFTINHIHKSIISDAHLTSAKYNDSISEFDVTQLQSEYKAEFAAPFVQGSPIQIGLKFLEEYTIKANNTVLILGHVLHLYVRENLVSKDGFIDLAKAEVVTINGLDGYAATTLIERFGYQRPKDERIELVS